MPVHKHRTSDQTRNAILALFTQPDQWLTRTEIAEGLRRKKSPFLIEVIEEMVVEGLLHRDNFTYHNGVQGFIYTRIQWAGVK
jgi:hypothetical protein